MSGSFCAPAYFQRRRLFLRISLLPGGRFQQPLRFWLRCWPLLLLLRCGRLRLRFGPFLVRQRGFLFSGILILVLHGLLRRRLRGLLLSRLGWIRVLLRGSYTGTGSIAMIGARSRLLIKSWRFPRHLCSGAIHFRLGRGFSFCRYDRPSESVNLALLCTRQVRVSFRFGIFLSSSVRD